MNGLLADFRTIAPSSTLEPVDWSRALLLASAVTGSRSEQSQDAVLRIAQSCLTSDDATESQKTAATILLERVGNRTAVDLAVRRELVPDDRWEDAATPLGLDVIKARLEYAIPLASGTMTHANPFQRDFWRSASQNDRVSFSAPTSSGKSFIVRRWLHERMEAADVMSAVFIVPTRALIDEMSKELIEQFGADVQVFVLPWDADIGERGKEVLVLTQERFHLLQQSRTTYSPDLLFVDEAQKFDDGARGILLEQVVGESMRRNPRGQVLFASPFSENPAELLRGEPETGTSDSILSPTVTVVQNLVMANQRKGNTRIWDIDLVLSGASVGVGSIELQARPVRESKRLPLVAVAMAGDSAGNILYVNTASSAETSALQVFDALGPEAASDSPDIAALIELSQKTVHPQYALGQVLQRGVAFHYGNMPALLRVEIERLFREGTLKYLVCTSTLLEGVNLPCKNLFVRGPRRGQGNPMSPADFWNLAGRAGRWGMEFQGNIICVDTNKPKQWPEIPRNRVRYPLRRASTRTMGTFADLLAYVEASTPPSRARSAPPFEALVSFLSARRAAGLDLAEVPAVAQLNDVQRQRLLGAIDRSLESVDLPDWLLARHAGISPVSMQRLLDDFRSSRSQSDLIIPNPEDDDAVGNITRAFAKISESIGGSFGPAGGRHFMLALLVVHWMRGYSLARIIAERIRYRESRGQEVRLPKLIRDCMTDVEQIARFEAPKFLACYVDVLREHFAESGSVEQMPDLPDIAMLLELGVARGTELALISLGLSRSTTIAVSEFIVADELSAAECLDWLRRRDLEALGLPALMTRELERLLQLNPDGSLS